MGVSTIQLFSDALGKWTTYSAILPEKGEGPFPVLFQLHGLSDDHDAWLQRSNLVRHVAGLPLIVVLPDGGTSGYLNWKPSGRLHKNRYEDLIVTDITSHLRRNFNVTDGKWAIGGLSMGGYGAMRLGLKYPERFASIWAHSSAFHIGDLVDESLADDEPVENRSVARLADTVATLAEKPEITFDCGIDDELIRYNRDFHTHLDSIKLPHQYNEHSGAHTWDYWDDHVREAIAQHTRVFNLVRSE
jgi:S-formylglutathione hydrolase FrmB